jgi:Putative beta-barrel porin-2, OmpL-like. bbp2
MLTPIIVVTMALGQIPQGSQGSSYAPATLGMPSSVGVPTVPAGSSQPLPVFGAILPVLSPSNAPGNSPTAQSPVHVEIYRAPFYSYGAPNGYLGEPSSCAACNGNGTCSDWQECCLLHFLKLYCKEFGLLKEKKDDKNGDKDEKKDEKKDDKNGKDNNKDSQNGNCDKDSKNGDNDDEAKESYRRALPEPWHSPPFPGHEYQGYPLIGVPPESSVYPLMQTIYDCCPWGQEIKDSRVKLYGWVTASGNWSTAQNSNAPASYWVVPNRFELDQLVVRLEREVDTVQTDHIDVGFRSTGVYGMDYRYTTAGGWMSNQLLKENQLYGFDPIEQYMDIYVPWVMEGMVVRIGRWVATPDIETQLAPDNYLASHSLLFTYDTYTQTGFFATFRPSVQWLFQAGLNAGDDMAPWYPGAIPCGFFAVRWVAMDNNDAVYAALNQINNAEFRHFEVDGQPAGHDNYNYFVATWEHRFCEEIHTKTESYFMWEHDAVVGGTPSIGPVEPFGSGGGIGATIPGWSFAYGVLNYTMFAFTKDDYITVRNEWWRDETGFRTGFAGTYTSHTIGLSHDFNAYFQIRPEIGYYRNWTEPAFDNGTKNGITIYGFDVTMRF